MPKNIPVIGLEEIGILVSVVEMDNGELRVRCMQESGSGYIWTEPPSDDQPSWQNAHFHKGVRETYIVQRGMMAFAEKSEKGAYNVELFCKGEIVTSSLGCQHNVYLFAGSAIHTVKHGTPVGNPEKGGADWYPADSDFDNWTKQITEKVILDLLET